jgi:gluconolactonase
MDGLEIIDERFRSMVLPNAGLEVLGEGFRWLEGPVWFADQDSLLFSDLPNDRIMRWTQASGVSVFREPSGFANGHCRDRKGRLIGCSHQHRCITRTELDGAVTTLVSHYAGKRLNAPNDVVCRSDGAIWFTDPLFGINTDFEGGRQTSELPPRVYRFDPAVSALDIVVSDLEGPNGLAFSPDERTLYVTEAGRQFAADPRQVIRALDISEDGRQIVDSRDFHKISPGFADGIRVDEGGNVWSSAADGVHCIGPDGTLLGKILTPTVVSNLAFGGRHRSRLFLCGSHTLYAIYTNVRGVVRP